MAASKSTGAKSKRSRESESVPSTPEKLTSLEVRDILTSINDKLEGLDARIALVELLHKEFQLLRESLEFSQEQITSLTKENISLKNSITTLSDQLTTVAKENREMKETILDLQSRSMRDNLVFSGIPEQAKDDPQQLIKDFMLTQLKIPEETVKDVTFHRVHRLGYKNPANKRPRPIIAKFEHFQQKQMVQRQGRNLKGTDFGMNDQFPREIMSRRKILFQIRKDYMKEGKKAVVSVDRLYVDGQLFRDKNSTPWLF